MAAAMLPEWLRDKVRCPACAGALNDVHDSLMQCAACGESYGLTGAIPDFVSARDKPPPTGDPYGWGAGLYHIIMPYGYTRIFGGDLRVLENAVRTGFVHARETSGPLLDVPVGTGRMSWRAMVAEPTVPSVAADLSLRMLDRADRVFRYKSRRGYQLMRADAGALPFIDAAFGAVVSSNGLHVFPDMRRALDECTRVLRPGGVFVGGCLIAGADGPRAWRRRLAAEGAVRLGFIERVPEVAEVNEALVHAGLMDITIDAIGATCVWRAAKDG